MRRVIVYIGMILVFVMILSGVAFIISNSFNISYENTVFGVGIITIIIGLLSLGGEASALPMQGFGQINQQYNSNATMEILKMIKKNPIAVSKSILRMRSLSVIMIISGVIILLI